MRRDADCSYMRISSNVFLVGAASLLIGGILGSCFIPGSGTMSGETSVHNLPPVVIGLRSEDGRYMVRVVHGVEEGSGGSVLETIDGSDAPVLLDRFEPVHWHPVEPILLLRGIGLPCDHPVYAMYDLRDPNTTSRLHRLNVCANHFKAEGWSDDLQVALFWGQGGKTLGVQLPSESDPSTRNIPAEFGELFFPTDDFAVLVNGQHIELPFDPRGRITVQSWDGKPRWLTAHHGGGAGTGLYGMSEVWLNLRGQEVARLTTDRYDANTSLWVRGGMSSRRLAAIDERPAIIASLWHMQEYVGCGDSVWEKDPIYRADQEYFRSGIAVFVFDEDAGRFILDEQLSDWSAEEVDNIGYSRVNIKLVAEPIRRFF